MRRARGPSARKRATASIGSARPKPTRRFLRRRQLAGKIKRHQTAPLRAVEAIEAAATLPFDEGCRLEREIFAECVGSEQAKALIHLFFAERAVGEGAGRRP